MSEDYPFPTVKADDVKPGDVYWLDEAWNDSEEPRREVIKDVVVITSVSAATGEADVSIHIYPEGGGCYYMKPGEDLAIHRTREQAFAAMVHFTEQVVAREEAALIEAQQKTQAGIEKARARLVKFREGAKGGS